MAISFGKINFIFTNNVKYLFIKCLYSVCYLLFVPNGSVRISSKTQAPILKLSQPAQSDIADQNIE